MIRFAITILVLFTLFFLNTAFTQNAEEVHLLRPEFSTYINLNDSQKMIIYLLIDEIQKVQDSSKARFEEMRKRRESGEQLGRTDIQNFRDQREKDVSIIMSDIEKIKAVLTAEQLVKFENVKLPDLRMRGRNRQ